jgi:hypothetical protein
MAKADMVPLCLTVLTIVVRNEAQALTTVFSLDRSFAGRRFRLQQSQSNNLMK